MRLLLLSFLVTATLVTLACAADQPTDIFKGPVGLQLYSLREQFKQDVPGTLDKVKSLGFKLVETAGTYGLPPAEFRELLTQRGLVAVSAHFQYEPLTKDLDAIIKEAKSLGVKFAICPWIPHEIGSFSETDVRRAAGDFNKWGEAFKAAGIRFGYHPHGYEFRPVTEGKAETLFDILVRETKPELVTFEMDVFWVVHPGQDPVKLLAKYPNRWTLMHLKDIRKGARTGVYTGKAPVTDDVPLGTGLVEWPKVLREAVRVGVQHFFIEDESPTVLEHIPQSLRYLESLKQTREIVR